MKHFDFVCKILFCYFAFGLFFTNHSFAVTKYGYATAPSTWSGGIWFLSPGGVSPTSAPTSGDVVIIESSSSTITVDVPVTIAGLTVNSGALLRLGSDDFTVNGSTTITGQLTDNIPNGTATFAGAFTVSSGGIFNVTTIGNTFNFQGDILNDGTFLANSSATFNFDSTPANISITNNGTFNLANGGLVAVTCAFLGGNLITVVPNFNMRFGNANLGSTTVNANVTISDGNGNVYLYGNGGNAPQVLAGKTLTNQNGGTGVLYVNYMTGGLGSQFINASNAVLRVDAPDAPFSPGGTFNVAAVGNEVIYMFSGAQSVRNSTYYHLTIENSSVKTLIGSATVGGNLSIAAGATLNPSSFNLNVAGTSAISGKFSDDTSGGTNTFSTVNVASSGTLEDVTTTGSNTFIFNGVLTNDGTVRAPLIGGNTSTFNFNHDITNNGTFALQNNGSYNFNKTVSPPLVITPNSPMTFGYSSGGGGSAQGLSDVTIANGDSAGDDVQFNGNFNVAASKTFTNNNVLGKLIFAYAGGLDGTGTFTNGASSYLLYKATQKPMLSGTANFDSYPNTVEYGRLSDQDVGGGTYRTLIVSAGGLVANKIATGNIIVRTFLDIQNKQVFALGAYSLFLRGDLANNNGTTPNCFSGTGAVVFNGTSAQTITNAVNFYDLIINSNGVGAGGVITLGGNSGVTNLLTLTQGILRLGNYDLTLSNATPSGQLTAAVNSYVETNGTGSLIRNSLLASTAYDFPIGDASNARNISINPASPTSASARYTSPISPALPTNAYYEAAGTWTINTGGNAASLTFYSPGTSEADAKVHRYITSWTNTGITTTPAGADYATNSITITGSQIFTLFSYIDAPTATSATNGTTTSFTANWTSVANADNYFIDVSTTADFSAFVGSYNNYNAGSATSLAVTGLSSNTLYFYRVRAYHTASSSASPNSNLKMTSTIFQPGSGKAVLPATEYVDAGNPLNMGSLSDITIEMWVKTPVAGTGMARLAGKLTTDGNNGWALDYDLDGRRFVFSVGTGSSSVSAGGTGNSAALNTSFHIAAVLSGNNMTLYQNGFVMGTNIVSPVSLNTSTSLMLGGYNLGGASYANMLIDDIRIWNTSLSQSTIRDNMCRKLTSSHSYYNNLIAYFPFDEGTQAGTTKYAENKAPSANIDGTYTTGATSLPSKAPLGDISAAFYSYGTGTIGTDAFTVNNFSTGTSYFHLYKVNEAPNHLTPPTAYSANGGNILTDRYWGVFVVDGTNPTFNITYNYTTNTGVTKPNALRIARRDEPNDLLWTPNGGISNNLAKTIVRREARAGEFILGQRNTLISNALNGGTVLDIDGASSKTAQTANPLLGDDFTIEFWTKCANNTPLANCTKWTEGRRVITFETAANKNDFGVTLVSVGGLNYFAFGTRDAAGLDNTIISSVEAVNDTWYHVAVTREKASKTIKIYINGKLAGTDVSTTNNITLPANANFKIGSDFSSGNTWGGYFDELRMWNTFLAEADIKDWMNLRANNSHPNYANLVAYYRFDENTVTGLLSEDLVDGNDMNLNTTNMFVSANQALGDGYVSNDNITTSGQLMSLWGAGTPEVEIKFGNAVPDGKLVVTRVSAAPNNYPSSSGTIGGGNVTSWSGVNSFMNCYWVIRNYGNNSTFDPLQYIKFEIPAGNTIPGAAVPSDLLLFKRPTNTTGVSDWKLVGVGTQFGSISFDAGGPTTIPDFSEFVIGSGTSPLAVRLVDFQGKRLDEQRVQLQWKTLSEEKNRGFEIQRSLNGRDFTVIGFADANQKGAYLFIDEKGKGDFYYRVLQTDMDGISTYSPIVYIKGEVGKQELTLYPNPTANDLKISVAGAVTGTMKAEVIDAQGKTVWVGKGNLKEIETFVNQQLRQCKDGVYIFRLHTPDKVLERKFVKQQ